MFKRIAKFEKVSFEQFYKDFKDAFNVADVIRHDDGEIETVDLKPQIKVIYDKIKIPTRATQGSAGYDFCSPIELNVAAGTTVKIPTGIRCVMKHNWVLNVYVRSSLGFKYCLNLANGTGIIDSDYSNSDNEGHIFIKLKNHGDKDCKIKQGDGFAQGIFLKYGLTHNDNVTTHRNGGFGSTNENKTSN